jgi:hypothetical protein
MLFFKKKEHFNGVSRRKHRRVLCDYPVEVIVGQKPFQLFARTISVGGLYITAPFELPLNTVVRLRIASEKGKPFIEAHGSVVYSQSGRGMGVKFVKITPEDQMRLQSIIEKSWWQEI